MGRRVNNNVNQRKYKDRNKLFAKYKAGDLIRLYIASEEERQLKLSMPLVSRIRLRALTKRDNGKFCYRDRGYTWTEIKNLGYEGFYKTFDHDMIGLYLGRYDGNAVILLEGNIYAININYIVKVNNDE